MGFVPGYENDIFISYSHIDNDPIIKGKLGWVDFFEDLLRQRVRVRLGGEINIFRDPQLRRYGKFSDQLGARISASAIFVCILSPRYVQSEWCLHELSEFCRGGTDRLIRVTKTAFDEPSSDPELTSLFAKIRDVVECRFYQKDENSGWLKDLQPEVKPDDIPVYLDEVDTLVQNLVELLKKLRSSQTRSPASPATSAIATGNVSEREQITVYLAEATKDLATLRNDIRTELAQFNCRVLPDQPLPQNAEDLISGVRKYLNQATLSVHMLGENYGTRPESEDRSIPHIQYDLATETSNHGGLRQLIWMPDDFLPREEGQERFLSYVRNTCPDFLRTKIEDLKTEIHKKLKPDPTPAWESEGDDDQVNVCLFCHEQDMKSVGPLYSYLIVEEMFRVKLPLKDALSFQRHKQILQASDAVLLYYGTADEDWFANIWRLIQRHLSSSRTKPVLAKAIYAGQPSTAEKNLLESDELMIIKNYGDFTPNSLTPFIEKIRAAKGDLR